MQLKVFSQFPKTFWTANTLELFERWAWYGMFNVLAIYLTASKDTGALGFTQEQKGSMMGIVTAMLYFLPVITGSIADKLGYKKVLLLSFGILSTGYLIMGHLTDYSLVFAAFFFIALGGALFKPVISATIAKTTNKENSSIGFGIFYMMVNMGAMIGPFVASKLRETSWDYVFYLSSAIIALNFVLVLFFYKEPARVKNDASLKDSIVQALKNIFIALRDFRFFLFLLIIVGFWSMYFQLFYTLPVFIDQWVNTTGLYDWLFNVSPRLAGIFGTSQGTVNPEMILNLDSLYIVVFQVIVSGIVMRLRPVSAMIVGIAVASVGIGLTFMFNNPFFLFFSILIFAFGEMASSPKITEYIGRMAPADKVGLYMGCSFLPMSGGNFLAGILSGPVYADWSDKLQLIRRDLDSKGIDMPELSDQFTQNDLFLEVARNYGMTVNELTAYLWQTYQPQNIWYLFTGIGLATALLLFIFDRLLMRDKQL
ncbi:MAG: MFS transporter [Bacteroidetes bacterium]|nr:MFS transporter [Bacteroidota bacterium]MBU1581005.1 MFS transporter [Bacteroidota bacterium]MBU2465937.1 MFS transporter [Bacteroidota bacterium]MBU2556345.1 MFS transporter [Bacteroidota bacterium]